jgi:hypothetical protein
MENYWFTGKNMKRKIGKFYLLFAFASLALWGCFSPWKGDEATLTLLMGNSPAGRIIVLNENSISGRVHNIELIGPTGLQSHTVENDTPLTVTVMPGYWEIKVQAFLDGKLYAKGSADADIKAGLNNQVEIKMNPIVYYTVTFDGNGAADAPPDAITTAAGVSIILPDKGNLEIKGYEFAGWRDETRLNDILPAGSAYTPTSDITLYAIWI